MDKLSDNYYQRKCLLEKEQVPTQSIMKEKMGKPLAEVYFKSMNGKLKKFAGLEPPMKGAGSDWYMPPEDILKGRSVLKPETKAHLKKLTAECFFEYIEMLNKKHIRIMVEEERKELLENDLNWKSIIETDNRQTWEETKKVAQAINTNAIRLAFRQFSDMYTTSLTKIESILFDGSIKEIQRIKRIAQCKMEKLFKEKLQHQARNLYDYYDDKLAKEKERLNVNFIKDVKDSSRSVSAEVHSINLEKHTVIEKLRQLLKIQNLACQVYVALKEREACKRDLNAAQAGHKKKTRDIKEQIAMTNFEISLAMEKERKRSEFNRLWQKKVCHVVKRLQMFVSFCLRSLPEYADFFIDMEKLMMLQLNNIIGNPSVNNIFVRDECEFHTPVPRPHPFYLFCDREYKPRNIDQKLCPEHCTSSASQLPVIVVNKRLIYAACDNFEKFYYKVIDYVGKQRGDDLDFKDNRDYSLYVPVKYTSQEGQREVKLGSSLLQVLQSEVPNTNELGYNCNSCGFPYCFCSPHRTPVASKSDTKIPTPIQSVQSLPSGNKFNTRSRELIHEREPKIESYIEFVTPKKCMCSKTSKKRLDERLPPYMRQMSKYETTYLPFYEQCPIDRMRKMVRKAQGKRPPPSPASTAVSNLRTIGTQYSDVEYDSLCDCFSDDQLDKLIKELTKTIPLNARWFKVVGDEMPYSNLRRRPVSFATDCAHTLRSIVDDAPQIKEIFKRKDCDYD